MEIKGNVLVKVTDDDITTGTFVVPSYIKGICSFAFKNCEKLICVVIPESVEEIGKGAFLYCENLEKVSLSYGITKINSQTFKKCESLQEIIIPNSVTKIDDGAFDGCTSLTNITIPDSVKSIGEYAFYDCKSLRKIIIPNSVTEIGKMAFHGCMNLKTIILSNQLTTIKEGTFKYCGSLNNVVVPESVKCIEYYAFSLINISLRHTYIHKPQLVLPTTLIGFNANSNASGIRSIKIGRTIIKNTKKFERIRKKEILTKIKEELKIRGINSKCYFKYEEHEVFVKMMLNELNKGVYIDFKQLLDYYINEFIKNKGLKIEEREKIKEEEIIYEKFGIKNVENFEYSLLPENQKSDETSFEILSNSNMSNETIIESNPIISEDSLIKNIQQEKEPQQEIDIKERFRKLSELPKEKIALIMDMVKNNIFDENIERYIDMRSEEILKILESESKSQQPYKVILEKKPIEVKAKQKVKTIK